MTKADVSTTRLPDGLITQAEDLNLGAVNVLSDHKSISVLTKNDLNYIEEQKSSIDKNIEAIKKELFDITKSVVERMKDAPYSSVIVDDTSARFIGLFVWKILKAEGAKNLPILFHRRDSVHLVRDPNSNFITEEWHEELSQAGNHPLVISEHASSGSKVLSIVRELSSDQNFPTIAVLGTDLMPLYGMLKDPGATDCFIGRGAVGINLWGNVNINGLALMDIGITPGARIVSYPSSSNTTTRSLEKQIIVNYSRLRLHNLVEEFLHKH